MIGERDVRNSIENHNRLPSARQLTRSKDGHRPEVSEHNGGKREHASAEHLGQCLYKLCQEIEVEPPSSA